MHRKGAQDAKRAKLFTKIIREITVAAKAGGSDPDTNPRLRAALINARSSNMGKETIEKAIHKGAGGGDDGREWQEIRYEGYGPGGAAILVETLTDNRNRTAPEIRSLFSKNGGNLGEINSVSYLFKHLGAIVYPKSIEEEKLMDIALEHDLQDFTTDEENHTITCPLESFVGLRDTLIQHFGDPLMARLAWIPELPLTLKDDHRETFEKLMDALEDHDDTQNVWSNAS